MRLGLRLQILLLLGGLLALAFVPLFHAVSTSASLTLQQVREGHASALGRVTAAHALEAAVVRDRAGLRALVEAQVGAEGVEALAVFDAKGAVLAAAGPPALLERLQDLGGPGEARLLLDTPEGRALALRVPGRAGSAVAVLRVDDRVNRVAPLVRLVGLTTGLMALALLVGAYFALTRLIVRPLDDLSRAARRVAEGGSRLEAPLSGARELAELGASLRTMTDRLLDKEQALRGQVEALERARAELVRAQSTLVQSERLASVGRLSAGLAHEVGNPIAALIGLLDLMLTGDLTEDEQRDFLQRMRRESDRIHRIIRDLLQFARPAEALGSGAVASGSVAEAAADVQALLGPQRSFQGVTLQVSVPAGLPEVRLTREQLVQVLLNLLLNAADACAGEGTVTLTATAREAAAPGAPRAVVVAVTDTGPGVHASVAETLFEPFVTTKEVGKGTGLGLAVCRGLVEAAGGTLRLDHGHAPGARFVLELPAAGGPGGDASVGGA